MLSALPAWRPNTDGSSNPGAKVYPSCSERLQLLVSHRESEEREFSNRGSLYTHGRSGPFPAPSFQVKRDEGVCFCPPRGGPPVS
ncbi:hypothetical protein PBY51_014282 [Eleginops maclovinus]|uniref:Uncharacterized protein n=1 Tax=Eleginops maclovinus TaxID=56733 RepID=A0AAN7WM74_ELEMC|nr:hypothetical protein PBY51_014282 [Eleginops maclovinus]